jgi:hypothetical protein
MLRLGLRVGGVLVVGLAGWLTLAGTGGAGGPGGKPLLPRADFDALVKQESKTIEDILAKGMPDKKGTRKVKAAAFMIAAYGHVNGDKGFAAAGQQLLMFIENGKLKEAADLAKSLAALKPLPGGNVGALAKAMDLGEVMHQFSSERVGGFGIEKELGDLAEAKSLTPEQLQKVALLAYKLAAISQAALEYKEERNEGGMKTTANWVTQAEQFRKAALDLAAAARSRNAEATIGALEKLNTSCVKCHDIFR